MIDIDYNDPISIVRSNIGDPNTRFVTDSSILSALSKYDGDTIKASVLLMETMLTFFSVQADESKTDEVEYKFTKLYERFKARLSEFKTENAASKGIPIFIGGTSLKDKNDVVADVDTVLPHMLDDWRTLQEQERLVENKDYKWDV